MDEQRLDMLFEQALKVPPQARAAWLDAHCDADPELRHALARLLAANDRADGVLEHPADLLAGAMADVIEAPRRFGVWRVVSELGAGGMGEVWLAERSDGQFEQQAAIKRVAWPTPGLLRRFRGERQILARLEHPGIARLIDGGVDDLGCPWLAMQYVEGVPITRWTREHDLGTRAIVELVLAICDAVQFAHRNLVVHSDIKPSNILVADGAPRLLDFGIARVLAQGGDTDERTRTMAQLLTPDYAAPELLAGGAITTSVDVYALGVLLYELLSGSRPYRLATLGGAAGLAGADIKSPSAAVDRTLPDARSRRRALRGDLDRIVLTAMEREPARRYASVEALGLDLQHWLDGRAIDARGHRRWYRFGKFVRRNRVAVAAISAVFVILIAATGYSLHEAHLARQQATRADAVRDFLVGVFARADPDAQRGRPITAHQLLEMGQHQLENDPSSRALRTEMQGLVGHLYWLVGDYPRALSLMNGAVSHPDPATSGEVRAENMLYLAQSDLEKSLFDAARKHSTAARELALRAGNAGATTASQARRLYADALAQDGNASAAEPILRQALREDSARFGPRSSPVADDLTDLAWALRELSRYPESIAYSRQAIALETALHGRASSPVINNLETLSSSEGHTGDLVSAERDQKQAVLLATRLYGPAHRETIVARSNLYFLYYREAQFGKALAGHLDLLELIRPMAKTRPEQLAYEWNFIALDYQGLARYGEALRAEQASLATWAGIHGSDSEYASNDSRTNLGDILTRMGRFKEAQGAYREAIRIERQHGPADSEWLNRDLGDLGNVYRMEHHYREAVAIISTALRALSPTSGPIPVRAYLQSSLALAQLESGDIAAARISAAQAERTGQVAYKDAPLSFSALQYTSARVALASNQPDQAETLLRAAYAARGALPHDDPRVVEVQVGLIRSLAMQGKSAEAQRVRALVEPVLAASPSPYFADLRRQLNDR
jgi:serine/threonine-protein kinase